MKIFKISILFFLWGSSFLFGQDTPAVLTFTSKIYQPQISQNTITLAWNASLSGNAIISYGETLEMENELFFNSDTENYEVILQNLEPSTFYYYQIEIEAENQLILSEIKRMATASNSTGEIRYFFLNGVDESFSNGVEPDGDTYQETLGAMTDLIDNAQNTIDLAIYNTNYYDLVDALEDAVDRGVRVRFIHDSETTNSALDNNLNFPTLSGSPGDGIMHNKFMIVDVEDDANAYLVTGSMNWTFYNITEDFNNTIIIQDKTLALNYLIEFEEMWGGAGDQPNLSAAKFGAQKTDNTAHFFNIGGVALECYFSPSDNVTEELVTDLQEADETIELGLFLITMNELSNEIKNRNFANVDVRGIIDETEDSSSKFDFLVSQGVNVIPHYPSTLLHHKYAIIDANYPDSDPTVITGSHNWSFSAETKNDENTLIFHDADAANLFLQEFEERWNEVGPVATFEPQKENLEITISPNPFNQEFSIALESKEPLKVNIALINSLGQVIYNFDNELVEGVSKVEVPTRIIAKGLYFLRIKTDKGELLYSRNVVKG